MRLLCPQRAKANPDKPDDCVEALILVLRLVLLGCQKRRAVKVRATNSMSFTPLFARRLGLGYFLAENVAWNGWEMGPPIWRRIEGQYYNDDSDTT